MLPRIKTARPGPRLPGFRAARAATCLPRFMSARVRAVAFAAPIDGMLRACREQAADLKRMALDSVLRALQLSDVQRTALDKVRSAAQAAADPLDAGCPNAIGSQFSEKLAALDCALQLMVDSLESLRPALAAFYASLDDEQKAQLVALGLSDSRLSRSDRKSAPEQSFAESGAGAEGKSTCLAWAANLRSWPVRQIESATALSDFQRARLYELAAAIYRAAGDLTQACPAENRLTPLRRLDGKENQLQALQEDIQGIQPLAAKFENTLSEEQRRGIEAAIGPPPDNLRNRRSSSHDTRQHR